MIRLRPLGEADLAAHAAGQDEQIVRWTNDGLVSNDEQHLDWLRRQRVAWCDGSDVVDLGIELVTTGELAGVVGIQRRLPYLTEGQVNLTYAVYPPHRDHGVASRAVRLAMNVAASRWPVREFIIRCDHANEASAAVARRLGFVYLGRREEQEGTLDWYATPNPTSVECHVSAVLAKLNAASRDEAVVSARQLGVLATKNW